MQLHYRGQSFDFQPSPNRLPKVAGVLPRTLIYRGNTYTCKLAVTKHARSPRAVNWRYGLPCETPSGVLKPSYPM